MLCEREFWLVWELLAPLLPVGALKSAPRDRHFRSCWLVDVDETEVLFHFLSFDGDVSKLLPTDHFRSFVGDVIEDGHFLSFDGDAIDVLDHFRSEDGALMEALALLVAFSWSSRCRVVFHQDDVEVKSTNAPRKGF